MQYKALFKNNEMKYFVSETSIVRVIWGKADTILFIFGGSAAEFALNKAVDWLYFTGKLPADPIGRLFSTLTYAQKIIFQEEEKALQAINAITQIHQNVEAARGTTIPGWAYRDVLYMLIHYSVAAFELLERKLTMEEKNEIYDVFLRMGTQMNLTGLPATYTDWLVSRNEHLNNDLVYSPLTKDLFKQYKKHLGSFRYRVMLNVQKLLVPKQVSALLRFNRPGLFKPLLSAYSRAKNIALLKEIKFRLLPAKYRQQLREIG